MKPVQKSCCFFVIHLVGFYGLTMQNVPRLFGKNRIYERWRWQIFFITWLAYAGFYLTRKSFTVAKIDIGDASGLGFSGPQMAWVDGSELAAYAIGQFFWGICGDHYGTRKIISIGMAGSILATLGMGSSSNLPVFMMFAVLQGFSQSSAWAPLSKNIGNFFSQHERGTVMGMWCTSYALGGFTASIFDGYFGDLWGWRFSFYAPCVVLFIIWLLFLWLQRNRPEDVGLVSIEQYHGEPITHLERETGAPDEVEGSWKLTKEVLQSPMIILLSAAYFFMKLARYAILLWTPLYLSERLGTDMSQSGALGGLFELAGMMSVLAAGILSDRFFGSRRNPITIVCLVLASVLLFTLDNLPHSTWMLGGCLFWIGFLLFPPDALIGAMAPVDFGTKRAASTAAGLINGFGSIGAIIGGTLPGFLSSHWGWTGIFYLIASSLLTAALLLLPKWNALPATSATLRREGKLAFENGAQTRR